MANGDNECVPLYEHGDAITAITTADVTGKRVVDISANMEGPANAGFTRTPSPVVGNNIKVAHAAAGARGIGVASWDAASGSQLYVLGRPGQVVPITAGAGITAGQQVEVGATGKVIPLNTGVAIGKAVADAANGTDAFVKLY